MKRVQKLPPVLFTVEWDKLNDKNIYFWYYKPDEEKPCRNICVDVNDAMQKIRRAEKAGYEAYVSCFVPMNAQHGVIAMTQHGRLHDAFMGSPYKQVQAAYNSVFGDSGNIQTQSGTPIPMQSIKAADNAKDTRLACRVEFPIYDKEDRKKIIGYSETKYTYKCRAYHLKEEWVTVKVWHHNENDAKLKNVRVVETFVTTERDLQLLAKNLGRKQIEELYCEQAIEL